MMLDIVFILAVIFLTLFCVVHACATYKSLHEIHLTIKDIIYETKERCDAIEIRIDQTRQDVINNNLDIHLLKNGGKK